MITNYYLQKNVDQLHARMTAVNHAYRYAFHFSFYLSLTFTAMEIMYLLLLLITMSIGYVRQIVGILEEVPDRFVHLSIDPLLASAPVICVVLSFISFQKRQKAVKIVFELLNVVFLGVCIAMLCLGFDFSSYLCAIFASVALHAVTIRCFIADRDDALLSKIPGYPLFDPLVMQDIEPDLEAREQARYREKSAEELIAEREREYLSQNPHSEAAIAERERQEIERGIAIENWLDEMLDTSKNPKDR